MMEKAIRKYALQNAVKFNGRANPGAVVGKVIQENPNEDPKKLAKLVSDIVKDVNSLKPADQLEELKKSAPELLEKKEYKKRDIFEFLKISEGEKIVTAFPPEPSKYPHIGHAKAILLNYLLAKKYKGKFILRFEDTNPTLAKEEFYAIHLENYKWLDVKPDKIEYASDYMAEFDTLAKKLLNACDAYVCTCPQEEISKMRMKGTACVCREKRVPYPEFEKMKEGTAVLRLKIDVAHKNSTMRDPAIMRIIDVPHVRLGNKIRVWPTYDFENSIMDGLEGVTHRLRSKEFEMRNELQRFIQNLLGFQETKIYEFARFNLSGVESSGRKIRELIDSKKLLGWDDPRLTTLVALRRRGFLPDAIKKFVVKTGISKSEATLTWDDLIVHDRRLLDEQCNRYFFVEDPVEIRITGAPAGKHELKIHPDHPKRGKRTFTTDEYFYISKNDLSQMKDGKIYRLMDCLNFTKNGSEFSFVSSDVATYKKEGDMIVHWLPMNADLVKTDIMMPDTKIVTGLAEPLVKKLKTGDQVQFERFGFCIKDRTDFWYTHK